MDYAERLKSYIAMVEARLAALLPARDGDRLLEAMRYSLLAGGKRIRPALALEFCRVCGGEPEAALDFACGVELLHTYSLIHDDLPCMDDDVLRRGRPTNHVIYGEWLATIAGDALQAAAFEAILKAPLPAEKRAAAALALAEAAGAAGMCGGQYLDMEGEGRELTLADVGLIHQRKTAALIRAAVRVGCIAAGADEQQTDAAVRYADALGLAFQIRDDLLDIESTEEELGKSVGKDSRDGKVTFVSLTGAERSRARVAEETAKAKAALAAFQDGGFLCWLADSLAGRGK